MNKQKLPLLNKQMMEKYIKENEKTLSFNFLIFIVIIIVIFCVFYFLYKNKKDYQERLNYQEKYYLNREKDLKEKLENKKQNSEFLLPDDLLLRALY